MSPFYNSETGEVRDEGVADDGTEHPAPAVEPEAPTPAAPKAATDAGQPAGPPLSALEARGRYDAIRTASLGDLWHPLNDERHAAHAAVVEEYLRLGMLADGLDAADPDDNPVLGELFEGARMRPPGADALSPAPRPTLPEGHAWDEGALVLGEMELHALGAPPHTMMMVTDELRQAVEAAAARAAEGAGELGGEELVRRWGGEGAQRMAEHARIAYQTVLESEHPLLAQRVTELGTDWGDDPGVIQAFAQAFASLFDTLKALPPSEKLHRLLERREARLTKVDAAAHARAAKARRRRTWTRRLR